MDFFKKLGLPTAEIEYWIKIFFQFIIILIGVFGNIYTIYGLSFKSKLHQSTNILMSTLSLALIIQSIVASMDHVNSFSKEDNYVLGFVGCDVWNAMNFYLPMLMNMLCFLCLLDRYILLKDPVLHKRLMSPNRMVGMALFCYISPAFVIVPSFYFSWYAADGYLIWRTSERCDFKTNTVFALVFPVFTFWVPLVLVAIVIIKLFCMMEEQEHTVALIANCSQEKQEEGQLGKRLLQVPWSEGEMRYQHRLALTLWSAYWNVAIFWIPHHIWDLVSKMTDADWPRAANFMIWCGYSPSMILPLIYYYYDIYNL